VSPRTGEPGFTLLEVLVAFAIAALALTVLLRATGTGLAETRVAARYDEAIVRARSHMAAVGRNAALTAGDTTGDDGGGFRWRLSVRPLASAAPAPTGAPDDPAVAGAPAQGASPAGAAQPAGAQGGGGAAAPPPTLALFAVEVGIAWTEDRRRREVVLRSERLGVMAVAR
jgi:general secretion pathway protein I